MKFKQIKTFQTSRRLAIMELNLEGVEDRAETAETYKLNF